MITIVVDDHGTTRRLAELADQARNPRALTMAVGRKAANLLRAHFRGKEASEPNKLGGKRQHFWLQVMRSVQAPVASGDWVTIGINHPAIAQKVFGGPISAGKHISSKTGKPTRVLSIPVDPEAYGRAPAVFEEETGAKLIFLKANGKALLATKDSNTSAFLHVRYVLQPSVTQKPDPTALPDMSDGSAFAAALAATAEAVVGRQLGGSAAIED